MSNKRSISILIGIIGILLMLLAGAFGYILGTSSTTAAPTITAISTLENQKVMRELDELKAMYDSKIAEKTNNYKALEEEKQKVQSLVFELEKTKNDANSLLKYKTQYKKLESKMKVLVNEIVVLKNKKSTVLIKKEKEIVEKPIEKTVVAPVEINKTKLESFNKAVVSVPKKEIVTSKIELPKNKVELIVPKKEAPKLDVVLPKKVPVAKIEKYSKITLSNIKVAAFAIKSAVKQIETTSASKADYIKITFTMDENPTAKAGDKTYYIQILNTKNNVIGKRITEFFDDASLTYSLSRTINYTNQTTECSIEFPYKDFEKGTYFITIFDRNELVGKSSFTLK